LNRSSIDNEIEDEVDDVFEMKMQRTMKIKLLCWNERQNDGTKRGQ
jgi:hypothetical protein